MISKNKTFIEKLRSSGLRPTRQRVEISKFLFNRKKTFHFSVDDLNKLLNSRKKKKISIATLYNTVHALKSAGHLKEFSLENNISYYDTNTTSHHHFYFNGKLIDIKNKEIHFKKIPTPPIGKKIKNVEVVIKLEDIN
mgnify:FL=1|tara:strand:- start:406 stop:819 length:414 start_codon:yes stop_codon:yes gene_type:complete